MLYGKNTTGMDVVNAYQDSLEGGGFYYLNPVDGSGVLPYQQVSIIKDFSSKILGQRSELPKAEDKMMSIGDLKQAISNPNQVVLFTFNTKPGKWISGHTVVLAAYDPQKGFGFLNSGAERPTDPNSLTWFSISKIQGFLSDPIGLWDNNFTVITRP
jgi:hypothetical protein